MQLCDFPVNDSYPSVELVVGDAFETFSEKFLPTLIGLFREHVPGQIEVAAAAPKFRSLAPCIRLTSMRAPKAVHDHDLDIVFQWSPSDVVELVRFPADKLERFARALPNFIRDCSAAKFDFVTASQAQAGTIYINAGAFRRSVGAS